MATKGSLTDLNLKAEPEVELQAVKAEDMPEERGAQRILLQPQHLVLRLPADLSKVWTAKEKGIYDAEGNQVLGADAKPLTKPRIAAVFDDKDILEIVNSANGLSNGENLECQISGIERRRGKDGPLLSALQYLLRGLGELILPPPTDFEGTTKALAKHAGKLFEADWEWSARCQSDRQAYFVNEETGALYPGVDTATDPPTEIKGCGEGKVYQSKWPTHKEEIELGGKVTLVTVYEPRAKCPDCFAVVYPFGELVRFAAHQPEKQG